MSVSIDAVSYILLFVIKLSGLGLGLGTSRSRLFLRSRDQGQDLTHLVSRPRPRPEPPGLETKTKTLATRSRDQDRDLSFQVSSELEFETLGLETTSLYYSHDIRAIHQEIRATSDTIISRPVYATIQIFTDEEERTLSDYLLRATKLHCGLSWKTTRPSKKICRNLFLLLISMSQPKELM